MSIIAKCDYCVLEGATYRRQTEIYDGILPDVMMCSNCGYAALFERERIIKLLHDNIGWCEALEYESFADQLEELIKGEQK
jgi:hypothetical protein